MKTPSRISKGAVTIGTAIFGSLLIFAAAPDSIEPMGLSFGEKKADQLRVLLVGSGSSHDFPKYFLGTDLQTLKAAGGMDVAATPNLDEALKLAPEADVIVFSGNHPQWGRAPFQKALNDHADSGKGLVILHAGAWVHPWEGYNQRFVAGGSAGHGYGEIEVTVKNAEHPVMADVPATFKITDESYHHQFGEGAKVEILAENAADDRTKVPHASVWVVKDEKANIVCITHGHAAEAHDNPAYQKVIANAVKWVAKR